MSKIEGQPSLVRDDGNMAIINTDATALLNARARKDRQLTQKNEINNLKQEVHEIRELLLKIDEKTKWQEQ
jgi:hypothetical protein|tara:strand:+ start:1593 stop:1805 length:213 start_codon:yes stop_codon:yes gene_type:complete